uniref:beta-galactosidase n=1 Tax=Lactuca sativa TaxID=4236 RepID=A0A9R1UT96_LACSA|nr:hypothetical protein LSAT_V11C800424990 [Lactuca sativa]
MVNFGAKNTIPTNFQQRKIYEHNEQVSQPCICPDLGLPFVHDLKKERQQATIDDFNNNILQDFVVNLWYSDMTPDKEASQLIDAIILTRYVVHLVRKLHNCDVLKSFEREDPTFYVGLDPESGQTIISGMLQKVDATVGKPRVNFRETITQHYEPFDSGYSRKMQMVANTGHMEVTLEIHQMTYFCLNGLIWPDRTPYPALNEVKYCYQSIKISFTNGVIKITNTNFFQTTEDLEFNWVVEGDGCKLHSGTLSLLTLEFNWVIEDESGS